MDINTHSAIEYAPAMPSLDMSGWDMLDFELALEGILQISAASTFLQNQPRAFNGRTYEYFPGAAFIVEVGEQWCSAVLGQIIDTLEAKRFTGDEDEDRRLRLLLHYHTNFGPAGEPLPDILRQLEQWRSAGGAK